MVFPTQDSSRQQLLWELLPEEVVQSWKTEAASPPNSGFHLQKCTYVQNETALIAPGGLWRADLEPSWRKELFPELGVGGLWSLTCRNLRPGYAGGGWASRPARTTWGLERSPQALGTEDNTVISNIAFPKMLVPWGGGQSQGSQFTENEVTFFPHFLLLAESNSFYNNYVIFTVLHKTQWVRVINFQFTNLSK